jgi:hypothetical protein
MCVSERRCPAGMCFVCITERVAGEITFLCVATALRASLRPEDTSDFSLRAFSAACRYIKGQNSARSSVQFKSDIASNC